ALYVTGVQTCALPISLVHLERDGLLDGDTTLLGISHGEGDDDALREKLGAFIEGDEEAWGRWRERITYLRGDFGDDALYATLQRSEERRVGKEGRARG